MILLWILLGITSAIALIISYYWIRFGAPWFILVTGLFGVSLFLFAVVWAIFSMSKGEPLSAALGMITFGIPAILLIGSGWKMLEAKNSED
jgi:hypothetical protein